MEREKVLKILGENPEGMKAQEIADKAGLTKAIVDKIIKDLKEREEIYSPKRCFYAVKK